MRIQELTIKAELDFQHSLDLSMARMDCDEIPSGVYGARTSTEPIEGIGDFLAELEVACHIFEASQQASIESEWIAFYGTVKTDKKFQTSADWNIFSKSLSWELNDYSGMEQECLAGEYIEFDTPEIHPAVIQTNGDTLVYSAAQRIDRCSLNHIASLWGW